SDEANETELEGAPGAAAAQAVANEATRGSQLRTARSSARPLAPAIGTRASVGVKSRDEAGEPDHGHDRTDVGRADRRKGDANREKGGPTEEESTRGGCVRLHHG